MWTSSPGAVVSEATRRTMQGNRSSDTSPEVKLRKALWAAGIRGYRKNPRKLAGHPDLVFAKARLAVFVHGCFWHCCPACYDTRWREPKTNPDYWVPKLARNVERDAENEAKLRALGYEVLVIWEHEVKKDLAGVLARIQAALKPN